MGPGDHSSLEDISLSQCIGPIAKSREGRRLRIYIAYYFHDRPPGLKCINLPYIGPRPGIYFHKKHMQCTIKSTTNYITYRTIRAYGGYNQKANRSTARRDIGLTLKIT